MATTYYNDIQKLYVAYFNRPADPKGLAFWETAVEAAKGSTAGVAAEFAKQAEYTAAFSGKTNAQIVDQVYQNLFGRSSAGDTGADFWVKGLDNKVITIADVVTAVAAGAQGTDKTAFSSKVTAAASFTAALDTDAEVAGYAGDAANKVGKTFLAGVTDALTLASATSPSALNATVATAVAAGTPFSVTSALSQVNAANKALSTFVAATVKTDLDLSGAKDAGDITTAKANAVTTVAADFVKADGTADTAASSLYTSTTSADVRAALVANQQTIFAQSLADAQAKVATDNANIAKVAGLSDAVSTLAAAKAALSSANAAETAALADLVAKQGAFGINNDAAANAVTITSTALTFNDGTTTATLADIDANGKATLHTGVTASDFVGLTELIAAINAEATADANVGKATDNVSNAQLGANLLDVAPTSAGTIAVTGGYAGTYTEADLIAKIALVINTTTPGTVAAGATPTLAQIQTELAVLKAAGGAPYTDFQTLVNAEATAASTFNPLVSKQGTDTAAVKSVTDKIADLAKDVAALQTASANADTLAGLQATVTAYNKVLTDKGYAVVTLDAAHTTNFAGATSDVYVVSNKDASIGAFGLQGTDQLFVGTGYTLVQGSATGTSAVKGNDAALEIFVSNVNGDTVLQIETHAYSSSVTGTGTGEIVTITLTGVDASHIKLDSTGIITAPAA
jgi:hypothetical protein